MRKTLGIVLLICVGSTSAVFADKRSTDLQQQMTEFAGDPSHRFPVMIHLVAQADVTGAMVGGANKGDRIARGRAASKATMASTQDAPLGCVAKGLLTYLADQKTQGNAGRVLARHWLDNSVAVDATASVVNAVAARADVSAITYRLAPPQASAAAMQAPAALAAAPVVTDQSTLFQDAKPNVIDVHAPEIWLDRSLGGLGELGQNAVVGIVGTGVAWHRGLRPRCLNTGQPDGVYCSDDVTTQACLAAGGQCLGGPVTKLFRDEGYGSARTRAGPTMAARALMRPVSWPAMPQGATVWASRPIPTTTSG